ncbi:C2 domain, Synaptotagmin-like mitochondrial-lipid-binding domain protein [Artemisia annua]|uniref:C2 domain, Synaptotagmin-like mitochondrial-lipid-binding domain protein n=1 Tax=Artemisia annua TaxID=35608 RepID=A0A2U1PQA6_ARTAN|nr:C2 domain, Synaptotagmin-like mitochondrial-lipid-binding domain protein [Artemisia annua]
MSFVVGLVIGIVLGFGFIFVFVKLQNDRSKSRIALANIVAAFARMSREDSRKLLAPEYYPSWVVFSQRQKLTSELIKENVEPVLEQYRPIVLSSLTFSRLTLGTVAPQFTGVSVIEEQSDGITLELEMNWDGNPDIVLDVKTRLGVGLPVQKKMDFTLKVVGGDISAIPGVADALEVKDIGFTGVFRLIFKPLVNEFPCFGAVSFSLRQKKKMDFTLKVVGGDISAIPGVADALESTIHDAVEDSITWPVRKVIPILPGDYSDLELKPMGTLEVKLVQAHGLTNKDLVGKSDPFAKLYIRPLRSRTKTSKVIDNDLNPVWNEHFEFVVEDISTQHLTVKIYDDDGLQASELIGGAQVKLSELEPGKVKDVWLKLVKDLEIHRDNKDRGKVHLELLYCPYGVGNGFEKPFRSNLTMTSLERALKMGSSAEDGYLADTKKRTVIIRGVLSVTVISAENLPPADLMGKADPFVVLTMKKSGTRNKTRVVNENLNPIWNQTFDFVVEDGLHDMLIVEVWDHDTFGKDFMGKCIVTLTRVILEGEYKESFQVDGTKSGKLTLNLKWLAQPLYRNC